MFSHHEFRGLLHADYEDALKNSAATLKSKKSHLSQRFNSAPTQDSTHAKAQSTTKELFQIPDVSKNMQSYMLNTVTKHESTIESQGSTGS